MESGQFAMNIHETLGRISAESVPIEELHNAPSHVYFIYSAGLVKIGFSTKWTARVDAVCQGCPHYATLVLVMPGDRNMERGYHALFHEYHSNGEWFLCEGKMREFLLRYTTDIGREELLAAEEAFKITDAEMCQ
jgi:Meiotically Up-regulated Gene 113 (MUG113) protein